MLTPEPFAIAGITVSVSTFADNEDESALMYTESIESYDILVSSSSNGYLEVVVVD